MEAVSLMIVYAGLTMFALNGILWIGIKQERQRIKAYEERLRRLYMRRKQ